jgi:hypothetical protein
MIIKDEYLIPKQKDSYMSVHHLVIEGTNEEIGQHLADIGRKVYDVQLSKYVDPIYAKARMSYFKRNWPIQHKRAKGVAKAFNLDPDNTDMDLLELVFDKGSSGCSAIFIPPDLSVNGHAMVARNYDWYIISNSTLHGAPIAGEIKFNARNQITELRPSDDGYKTLHISSNDLLNPWLDGINEKGLYVTVLFDPGAPIYANPTSGQRESGLSMIQVPNFVLSQFSTVQEAKEALLQQHIYFSDLTGIHYLIADKNGAATTFEVDGTTGQYHFTDAQPGKPFIVTNYPLYKYPDRSAFPQVNMDQEHNTFTRVCILKEIMEQHKGRYTAADMRRMIDSVKCAFVDGAKAGVSRPFPERTIWSVVTDLNTKNMSAFFYKQDLGPIPNTNHMEIERQEVQISFSDLATPTI